MSASILSKCITTKESVVQMMRLEFSEDLADLTFYIGHDSVKFMKQEILSAFICRMATAVTDSQ